MGYIVSNHDFTHGEIDKTLFARSDLIYYNKSAQELRNFCLMPGGGVRSRFGTTTVHPPSSVFATGSTHYQMISWRTTNYDVLVIISNIAANGIAFYNITSSGAVTLIDPNPFPPADVENRRIRFAQNQNELIMVSDTTPPQLFSIDPTSAVISDTGFTFKNNPVHDFYNNYDACVFDLSDTEVGKTATLTITLSGPWAGLTSDYVGGIFEALGPTTSSTIGRATITAVASATSATVTVLSEFADTSGSSAHTGSYLGTHVFIAETAYNATRGWPKTVAFYEDRMLFGGSPSLPQSLFFSVTGNFRDFSTGQGLPSDGIAYTIATGAQDSIVNLVSSRSLQVFTTSTEMAAPVWGTEGLSSENVAVRGQTSNGSEPTIPVVLDNSTLFIKKGGKAVLGFNFENAAQSYNTEDVSIFSTHLVDNPVDLAAFTENQAFDSNMLFLINSDGTLAIYETLAQQEVSAWVSTSTFEGTYKNVCVVGTDVFFITNRPGNQDILELLDWSVYIDASVTYVAPTTGTQDIVLSADDAYFTSLSGVQVVTDISTNTTAPTGTYVATVDVNAANTIEDIYLESGKTYYIGLPYSSKLKTMPAHVMTPQGDTLYTKKTISKVYVNYVNSYPFRVNGVEVPLEHLHDTSSGIILDDPLPPSDGIFVIPSNLSGWSRKVAAEITMDLPLPVMILGLSVQLTA